MHTNIPSRNFRLKLERFSSAVFLFAASNSSLSPSIWRGQMTQLQFCQLTTIALVTCYLLFCFRVILKGTCEIKITSAIIICNECFRNRSILSDNFQFRTLFQILLNNTVPQNEIVSRLLAAESFLFRGGMDENVPNPF